MWFCWKNGEVIDFLTWPPTDFSFPDHSKVLQCSIPCESRSYRCVPWFQRHVRRKLINVALARLVRQHLLRQLDPPSADSRVISTPNIYNTTCCVLWRCGNSFHCYYCYFIIIHRYIKIYIAPKSWIKRIWGAEAGWLDGKSGLEEVRLQLTFEGQRLLLSLLLQIGQNHNRLRIFAHKRITKYTAVKLFREYHHHHHQAKYLEWPK